MFFPQFPLIFHVFCFHTPFSPSLVFLEHTLSLFHATRTHRNSHEPSIPQLGVHFMGEWHLAICTMWTSELQQRGNDSLTDAHASMEPHRSRHACSTRRCTRGISSRERALANWLTNALVSANLSLSHASSRWVLPREGSFVALVSYCVVKVRNSLSFHVKPEVEF